MRASAKSPKGPSCTQPRFAQSMEDRLEAFAHSPGAVRGFTTSTGEWLTPSGRDRAAFRSSETGTDVPWALPRGGPVVRESFETNTTVRSAASAVDRGAPQSSRVAMAADKAPSHEDMEEPVSSKIDTADAVYQSAEVLETFTDDVPSSNNQRCNR